MNAAEKAEALASIRQDLGGLGLGLVLGAVACYFVRPKKKSTNALEMAQRWLAWGLLGSVSSGISFWVRNYDKGGMVGGLITILFFSGLAWGLGYVWGLIKFAAAPSQRPVSTTPTDLGPKSLSSMAFMGFIGAAILALVAVSGIKDGWNTPKPKNWWEEPGAVEKVHKKLGIAPAPNISLDELAEQGNPHAQLRIGRGYLNGREGKTRDPELGVEWIRKAADQGLMEAQELLGLCYLKGVGGEANEAKAADVFEQAANNGSARAARLLSYVHAAGIGKTENKEESVKWLRKAAEQGEARAQFELGRSILQGESAPVSLYGSSDAMELKNSEDNNEEGASWITKAAEQGEAEAQLLLGRLYRQGKGVPTNAETGYGWTERAAEQGLAEAQYELGWRLIQGDGASKDFETAIKWQTRAAEQEYAPAQTVLGALYVDGVGVTKDATTALAWFYKAKANADKLTESELSKVVQNIETLEKELGMEHTLRAQQLAKTLVPETPATAATK